MNQTKIDRLAGLLASGAGLLDFFSGFGLISAPQLMLRLLGVTEVFGDLVYLRFVGAFVAAVGFSYLWAIRRWKGDGDRALLRATLEITIIFRLASGAFVAWAILRGWLVPAWSVVTLADFVIVVAQGWLLARGALR